MSNTFFSNGTTLTQYGDLEVPQSAPKDFFGKPQMPIMGSSFSLRKNPFSGVQDFGSTGGGGFFNSGGAIFKNGGKFFENGEMSHTGQIVQTGQRGAGMSGYRLEMEEKAKGHRERNHSNGLWSLGNIAGDSAKQKMRAFFDEPPSKKRRGNDGDWLDTRFADGVSTAGSASLSNFGFDSSNMGDMREMSTTKGFHTNGRIVGERVTLTPPDRCNAPGQQEIIITSKYPFIGGFGINTNPGEVDYEFKPMPSRVSSSDWAFMNGVTGQPAAPRMGFSIASFNFWIAHKQKWSTQGTTPNDDEKREGEYTKHFNLIFDFLIHGVGDSETFANNGSSFMNDSYGRKGSSPSATNDKAINIAYEGDVVTQNYWGPVEAHVPLYLIWKKVKRPEFYVTARESDVNSIVQNPYSQNQTTVQGTDLSEYPFQLVPWADPKYGNDIPYDILEFKSDHIRVKGRRSKRVGYAFRIGYMLKPSEAFSGDGSDRISRKHIQEKAIYDLRVGQQDLSQILVEIEAGSACNGKIKCPTFFPLDKNVKNKYAQFYTRMALSDPPKKP